MTEKLARLKEVRTAEPPTAGSQRAHYAFDDSVLAGVTRYSITESFPLFSISATYDYLRRRLASGEGIVCVRRISLGGEGNALYPVLSG